MAYPIKTQRADDDRAKAEKMLGSGYKRGGAVRGDASINITINAPGKKTEQGADEGDSPLSKIAGLAAAAKAGSGSPMPMPPPGGPASGPPLSVGGGSPIGMKRGGRVQQITDGGAGSGVGRLEKAADQKRAKKS